MFLEVNIASSLKKFTKSKKQQQHTKCARDGSSK